MKKLIVIGVLWVFIGAAMARIGFALPADDGGTALTLTGLFSVFLGALVVLRGWARTD